MSGRRGEGLRVLWRVSESTPERSLLGFAKISRKHAKHGTPARNYPSLRADLADFW